ncbi:MAG: hypothetical protein IMZ46_01380, partial [Acidobacteria bacterium]|nr:hypothetical protein [Acidobacteriota bacterium]
MLTETTAISYSCIAPLILGFATVGIYVIYLVYRYNLLYIHNTSIDTRGLVYPQALMQLLVGLYLAEACMIGLFVLRGALGAMALMILFLIFSVLVHLSISDAISPLLYNLPRTLSLEGEELERGGSFDIGQDDAIHPDHLSELDRPFDVEEGKEGEDGEEHVVTGTRGVEGADGFVSSVKDVAKDKVRVRAAGYADRLGLTPVWNHVMYWVSPPRTAKPNFLLRFLHPGVFEDFAALQGMLPDEMPDPTRGYPEDYARQVYWPLVVRTPMETLRVPRDEAGVSRQEVRHAGAVMPITDEGAWLEEDGALRVDVEVG